MCIHTNYEKHTHRLCKNLFDTHTHTHRLLHWGSTCTPESDGRGAGGGGGGGGCGGGGEHIVGGEEEEEPQQQQQQQQQRNCEQEEGEENAGGGGGGSGNIRMSFAFTFASPGDLKLTLKLR